MPPTKLIYQHDSEKLQHASKIISAIPISDLPAQDQALAGGNESGISHAIVTDSTIFYVQGGGQPADIGTMKYITTTAATSNEDANANANANANAVFEVKTVRQPTEGTQVLHLGHFTPSSTNDSDSESNLNVFSAGTEIYQEVDSTTRTLHSRLHTAGHIMSLAIHALVREGTLPVLKEVKASHYPDSAAVTFEGTIEGKFKEAIQRKTDEFVKSAKPVRIHWWSMEELRERCYGVTEGFELPAGESLGRVVEMEGLGSYPCGGTHVGDCSLVGKIVVKKISRSKGVSRVSYTVE